MAESISDNVEMVMRVADRGRRNPMASHVLEDVIAVIDGRAEIVGDVPPRRQTSVPQSPLDSANFWHAGTQKTLLPPSFSRMPRVRTVCR